MSALPFDWILVDPPGRPTWKAVVGQGSYEIDHRTLAARFVCAAPASGAETIPHPFSNLEDVQWHCEEHWKLWEHYGSDNSSGRRAGGDIPPP